MENHPMYQKLKQVLLDGSYTIEQVRSLDFTQAATLLIERPASSAFFENMKQGIVVALQNQDDEVNLQQVKQKVMPWLDANFPDWEAERGRQGGKPYVTVWLEGKP